MFNWLKRPWLHFLLIGGLLYSADAHWQEPALKFLELPDRERIEQMRGQWLRTTGREPSAEQLQFLIDDELNRQILFNAALEQRWHLSDPVVQQRLVRNMRFLDAQSTLGDAELFEAALDMDLHLNDLVVKRRLIQRMEMLAFATVAGLVPDDSVLQSLYQQHPEQYRNPELRQFQQIFVSADRYSQPGRRAEQLLAEGLTTEQLLEHWTLD
ncbi:MAG: peptidyl-prolyl cis-trans isomerase [Halieaceae bacterium]|nr:peptidyl-prolyl cis-trans isomerase [Halieaceae bacterium]